MASPHRSAEPAGQTGEPARWLRLSLVGGSLSAAVLAASLVLGWGLVPMTASATVLLIAVLCSLFWFAELEYPVPSSAADDADPLR